MVVALVVILYLISWAIASVMLARWLYRENRVKTKVVAQNSVAGGIVMGSVWPFVLLVVVVAYLLEKVVNFLIPFILKDSE